VTGANGPPGQGRSTLLGCAASIGAHAGLAVLTTVHSRPQPGHQHRKLRSWPARNSARTPCRRPAWPRTPGSGSRRIAEQAQHLVPDRAVPDRALLQPHLPERARRRTSPAPSARSAAQRPGTTQRGSATRMCCPRAPPSDRHPARHVVRGDRPPVAAQQVPHRGAWSDRGEALVISPGRALSAPWGSP